MNLSPDRVNETLRESGKTGSNVPANKQKEVSGFTEESSKMHEARNRSMFACVCSNLPVNLAVGSEG